MSDDLVDRLRLVGRTFMPELMHGSANEIERLRAERDALRALAAASYQAAGAHDWPDPWLNALSEAAHGDPFGNPMELLPMDSPDHLLRAERAETENVILREVAAEAELNREGLRVAHAELAKLRARIDGAPILTATRNGVVRTKPGAFLPGKRVALVVVDE